MPPSASSPAASLTSDTFNNRLIERLLSGDPLNPDLHIDEVVAALLMGLSRRTLQQMRVDGDGPPFVKISARAIRYKVGTVLDWLKARTKTSTSQP